MRYLSVCSGIGADAVAWHPLGWECAGFCEIDPKASAVLAHRFPETPNYGNFTELESVDAGTIDLLVGGTPCQSFSIAARNRKGLDDPRGDLAVEFCRLAHRIQARWIVWENVPGVLSIHRGRDFGAFLETLVKSGYGVFWRILDAQYIRVQSHPRAVPQCRRRVFVVGYIGDWRPSAAVLFEPESLRGDSAPSRKTGEKASGTLDTHIAKGIGPDEVMRHCVPYGGGKSEALDVAPTLTTYGRLNYETEMFVTAFNMRQNPTVYGNKSGTIDTASNSIAVGVGDSVRRLTPLECERLQGFPDGYTKVNLKGKVIPTGSRYRLLGNAVAVNVMRWIGERIALFEKIRS